MLARTLAQFRSGVRRITETESKTDRHPNPDLDVYINQSIVALREFVSDNGHHYFLVESNPLAMCAGTTHLVVPSDMQRLYSLEVGGCQLEDWTFQDRWRWDQIQSGPPRVFRILNSVARIYPVSDGAYAYSFTYLPDFVALSADNDPFYGMPDWFEWIELDAAENVFLKDKDIARQQMALQRKAIVEERIRKHAPKRQRARVVRRRLTRDAKELCLEPTMIVPTTPVVVRVGNHLVKIRGTGEQVIPNAGSPTSVQLDAVEFAVGNAVLPPTAVLGVTDDKIRVRDDGYYFIAYELDCDPGVGLVKLSPTVDGAAVLDPAPLFFTNTANGQKTVGKAIIVRLPAGAAVGLTAFQTTGADLEIEGASLTVWKLSDFKPYGTPVVDPGTTEAPDEGGIFDDTFEDVFD